jgi:hypothetical protein
LDSENSHLLRSLYGDRDEDREIDSGTNIIDRVCSGRVWCVQWVRVMAGSVQLISLVWCAVRSRVKDKRGKIQRCVCCVCATCVMRYSPQDCTRPALSPGATYRHSTGEIVYPVRRSKILGERGMEGAERVECRSAREKKIRRRRVGAETLKK